jgi:hypothetical protein
MSREYDDIFERVTDSGGNAPAEPSPYASVWQAVHIPERQEQTTTPATSVPMTAYQRGRQETDREKLVPTRVLGTFLNGLTFGFGDEILGGVRGAWDTATGEGPQSFSQNYKTNRDYTRGVIDQYKQEFPVSSTVAEFSGAGPIIMGNALGRGATTVVSTAAPKAGAFMSGARGTGFGANAVRAGVSGASYGVLGGAGNSRGETFGDVATDAALGGLTGAIAAPILLGTTNVLGAVGSNVVQRVNQSSADDHAARKVAEALARDSRGAVFQSNNSNPANQSIMRLKKLGPEARVVDAGGQNTRQLLDTLATLPGQTKNATEIAIHNRQAGRGVRLATAADNALKTRGAGYQQTIEALDAVRKKSAEPLYRQLSGHMVTVDDDVVRLLGRTMGNHAEAQNLYRLQTGQVVKLSDIKKGDSIPFSMLDTLKQSLYDAADTAKRQGSNKMGAALDDVRVQLTNKLDDLAPKDPTSGMSIYRLARDAYAGPSQLMGAAELGRRAMRDDVFDVAAAVRNMSKSEQEAFRVGALQALREKTGTQSGQTNLLNMWKEPATQQRLKAIFGNDYRAFAADVAREARLKGLDTVGRGSQTASRQAGFGDVDLSPLTDAAQVVTGAATGNRLGVLNGAASLWGRVSTPESVRNKAGSILLSQGLKGTENLQILRELVERINREQALQAARVGVGGGIASGGLTNSGLIGSGIPGYQGGLLSGGN